MYHHITKDQRLPLDGKLAVPFANFAAARAEFPNDVRTALRGFALSEAARYANRLICAPNAQRSNVVLLFSRADISLLTLRQKRFDFVVMLLKTGKFERRVADKLIRQGDVAASELVGFDL